LRYIGVMSSLTITLPQDEAQRLAELAKREGATPEAVAEAAVRARLDEDACWEVEVKAGIADLDAGHSLTLENFEREMDEFMSALRAARG
jgi:predicted transcriptional regulator